MNRLELEQTSVISPEEFEERFQRVNALLHGDGLPLDDLKIHKNKLLGPSMRLGSFIGILAKLGQVELVEHYNSEGGFFYEAVRYFKDEMGQLKEQLKIMKANREKKADEARDQLGKRGLIPSVYTRFTL